MAYLSSVIVILASVPYVVNVVKKRVKPERISWLLWTMLGATYFAGAIQSDGVIIFALADLLASTVTFILSFKYGVGGKSRFDRICLAVAIVAFILLLVADNILYGLILAIFVDAIGSMLTIRKLLKDRTSEPKMIWGLYIIAASLAIAALDNFSFESLLFPVYVIVIDSVIFLIAKSSKGIKSSRAETRAIEEL